MKKTVFAAAMVAAMGATSASAAVLTFDWEGKFTMLSSAGGLVQNPNGDVTSVEVFPGFNLDVTGIYSSTGGQMVFDTDTGAGTGTMQSFQFNDNAPGLDATAYDITFQAIGDGQGGAGTLIMGNMLFSWNGNTGIPVSVVLDAAGMFGALQGGMMPGDTVSGVGASPAIDGVVIPGTNGKTINMGPVPVATTSWNTSTIAGAGLGTNPSGELPLTDDGIGGSPMIAGPFDGFNANFNITSLTLQPIPVPAAVWLLGSGLLGLVGVARRRKASA